MKYRSLVDRTDYILIGVGILLLPLLLIGLIFIGISVFRIGSKWEQNEAPEPEEKIEYIREEELMSLR